MRPQPNARAPSRSVRTAIILVAPTLACLAVASWMLWAGAEPSRQGGYCANATVVIADSLARVDTPDAAGRGPLPDIGALIDTAADVDVSRLQVNTPVVLRSDVAVLSRAGRRPGDASRASGPTKAAFARIAADYLQRCRGAG